MEVKDITFSGAFIVTLMVVNQLVLVESVDFSETTERAIKSIIFYFSRFWRL